MERRERTLDDYEPTEAEIALLSEIDEACRLLGLIAERCDDATTKRMVRLKLDTIRAYCSALDNALTLLRVGKS